MPAVSPKPYCSVVRIHLSASPKLQAHLLNNPINSLSFLSPAIVSWFYPLAEGASEWLKSVSPRMLLCSMSISMPLSQPIESLPFLFCRAQGVSNPQEIVTQLNPSGYKLSVLWKVTPPPNVVMGQWPSVWCYFLLGTLAWPYRICPFRGIQHRNSLFKWEI